MPQAISLGSLCNGAISEQFAHAWGEAMKNIADPNFPDDKKRTITITIALTPYEGDRSSAMLEASVQAKLPGRTAQVSTIWISQNSTGAIAASEVVREQGEFNLPGISK